MTTGESGTAFEAVSTSLCTKKVGLTQAIQARNGGLPKFERRASIKADYDLGKSAWSASSRIWGTSKSFLDGVVDEMPNRRRSRIGLPGSVTDSLSASPVHEGSFSSYAPTKGIPPSGRPPSDLKNENAPQSKMPWGSVSTSIGFPSQQRAQPLSPTLQRQNQIREFVIYDINGANGNHDQPSLFAGSDPDVDDIHADLQQNQNGRRGFPPSTRTLPSPTRTMIFGPNHLDSQLSAFDSSLYHPSGVYAPSRKFEDDRDQPNVPLQQNTDNLEFLSLRNGYHPFPPSNGVPADTLYRYNPRSPIDGRVNGRSSNPEQVHQFRPRTRQDYDEVVRSFGQMALEENGNDLGPQRLPLVQHQFPRDVSQLPAHLGHLDSKLDASALQVTSLGSRLNPQAPPHYGSFQHQGRNSYAPLSNDYRSSLNSPYYSTTGTPPTGPQSVRSTPGSGASSRTSHHDPYAFERALASTELYTIDSSLYAQTSMAPGMSSGFQYDIQIPGQPLRMNPLANPYVSHGHSGRQHYPSGPRMPAREPDQAHVIRSPLLEEFRLHSKHNRRYELKDIYGYVVEFSGDQHGSRFIQQKLETANSDEKEQIFKELQPNLLQLMTDVFGNYVIQKIFEHGNQTQKKILANHMKGYVHDLSMQMYGCRVVQKAFEHVLVDQQASLVKELDGPNQQLLRVVKDQNGNHVVQKAIERIPGEHIQFILDAHRGQMAKMSQHQYGCRVVQRMLEHCQPQAKRVILDELLEHIHPLISDSFGNYVVQHIIHNGEPQDRRQVVDIILQQVLVFSKHKFASNIVEKSIDCADEDQRTQILRGLTGPDETGATPVLGLMRDQYGNYVLRKSFLMAIKS